MSRNNLNPFLLPDSTDIVVNNSSSSTSSVFTGNLRTLNDCKTVSVSPQDGSVLSFSSSSKSWYDKMIQMKDFSDFNTSANQTGDLLMYDNGKWTNTDVIADSTYFADLTYDRIRKFKFNLSNLISNIPRTLSVPDASCVIVGDTTVQTLTNKSLTDASTYFIDDSDNTKQLQFQLSGITTGQTRILTIPNYNTTIVGTDANQTLTNKTISDQSNTVTCDYIRMFNSLITLKFSSPPTQNQVLTALTGTSANWQTISHLNLSDIGTNTHSSIDNFINSKNQPNGIPSLGNDGLLIPSQLSKQTLKIDYLYFLNNSMYNSLLEYFSESTIHYYIIDNSNRPNVFILPDNTTISNGYVLYIQIIGGSAGVSFYVSSIDAIQQIAVLSIANWSTTFNVSMPVLNNKTYKLTYYTNSTNPWQQTGMTQNSWKLDDISNVNKMPIYFDIDLYLVNSVNISTTANIILVSSESASDNGKSIMIKDVGGHMNMSSVNVYSNGGSDWINNNGSNTYSLSLNSANSNNQFVYFRRSNSVGYYVKL